MPCRPGCAVGTRFDGSLQVNDGSAALSLTWVADGGPEVLATGALQAVHDVLQVHQRRGGHVAALSQFPRVEHRRLQLLLRRVRAALGCGRAGDEGDQGEHDCSCDESSHWSFSLSPPSPLPFAFAPLFLPPCIQMMIPSLSSWANFSRPRLGSCNRM